MYDRTTARPGRRRNPRLSGRRRNGRRNSRNRTIGWIIALAVAVPVTLTGVYLAHGAPVNHLTTSADVQGAQGGMSGWGRGGFPMMPGSPGTTVLGPVNAADAMSANWAGYAAAGQPGAFTAVSASWSEPAVTCANAGQTFSAFWVGLDGDGTPTVEQTGTEADCANGAATYQGWYEIFPNAPVFYNNPVQPADAMNASVTSDGNGVFTLTLSDSTQGWTQTTQQSEPNAQLGSAEIIAEAPSNGQQVLPLANFGTVSFSNVAVDNQPLGSENPTAITMASGNATLATPSALTGTNAFGVTWNSSGATPAAGQAPAPATSPSPSPSAPASSTGSGGDWIRGTPGSGDPGDGDTGTPWWNAGF